MSLTYSEMQALCEQLQPLVGGKVSDCIETAPYHFNFIFNKEICLLVCLQEPFLRFHLVKKRKKEIVTSQFGEKLKDIAVGKILEKIELLHNDRILMLSFGKYHFIAELFPKSSNAYVLDDNKNILCALKSVSNKLYNVPEKRARNELPISKISNELIEERYEVKYFDQEKQKLFRHLNLSLKRALKHKEKSENDLKLCYEWENIHHEGLLLQSYLYLLKPGMNEISVPDWKQDNKNRVIALDPTLTPSKEIARRFQKSKKLRTGIPHVQNQIQKASQEITLLTNQLTQLEKVLTFEDLHDFEKQIAFKRQPQAKPALEKSLPYREFYTASGLPIWVGKSAKNNEELTFRYAKGSDWWLHVTDYPGSHVILKGKKENEPDQESIQDAVQLALHYSKAKDEGRADICLTQCKYVTRFGRGQAGKVQISKHRVIHAKYDPERLNQLKKRNPSDYR